MSAQDHERQRPHFDLGEFARANATGAVAGGLALALFYAVRAILHAGFGVPLW